MSPESGAPGGGGSQQIGSRRDTDAAGAVEIRTVGSILSADAREAARRDALRIFWETAQRSDFADAAERQRYERMYFGYYWEEAPDLFLLAFRAGALLGYCCAVADTRRCAELYTLAPYLGAFEHLYDRFPSHLHINLTAGSRGLGLGGRLIGRLEEILAADPYNSPGLHLITGAGARNVSFYRRNGFTYEERAGENDGMLFMGKTVAT